MQWIPSGHSLVRAFLITVLGVVALAPVAAAQDTEGVMTPVEVVEQVGPAVVTVINEQTISDMFGTEETVQAGAGTGFIIDDDGHIVTNWHVVTGGSSFFVILSDGTEVDAELIGEDPRDDLAVVRIDPGAVPATVPLGDSDELRPGQAVLAIGSPLGAFGNTVTAGIVSALDRDQLGQGRTSMCMNYSDLIQHDAAINPGNSGGPLFNLNGEVVGVNTLGIPQSPSGVPVQGIFFAVPSNTVTAVVQQMIDQGFISAPYIGINLITLTPQLAALNDLPVEYGVYVDEVVSGGPAEQAGLQPGDIILAIDGNEINPLNTLAGMLLDYEPGESVTLTVLRGGDETSVDLTFGEAPEEIFEQCVLEGQP